MYTIASFKDTAMKNLLMQAASWTGSRHVCLTISCTQFYSSTNPKWFYSDSILNITHLYVKMLIVSTEMHDLL
jgi:hypothetical protein